jgi:hypothetical protein
MRDGTRSEADWDTQSIASTQMLEPKFDADGDRPDHLDVNSYLQNGPMAQSSVSLGYPQSGHPAGYVQPHESTDYLLNRSGTEGDLGEDWHPQQVGRQGSTRHRTGPSDQSIAMAPLLARDNSEWGRTADAGRALPYPPTSYASPPPGYATAPLSRSSSQQSRRSSEGHAPLSHQQSWTARDR